MGSSQETPQNRVPLALTPFCGHAMNTSLEWAVAWSLVGEWTCRELFPPPKGQWPRSGHPSQQSPDRCMDVEREPSESEPTFTPPGSLPRVQDLPVEQQELHDIDLDVLEEQQFNREEPEILHWNTCWTFHSQSSGKRIQNLTNYNHIFQIGFGRKTPK